MPAEIMQAQRLRIADQQAKDAVAGGQRTDLLCEFVVNPYGNEVAEGPVASDHSQGAILCFHQVAG